MPRTRPSRRGARSRGANRPTSGARRADVLFHPERLRIVQTLANAGGLTTQQIAARLPDIAPATLYRHLQRLTDAGIAVVAAERPVRGVVERTYTVTAETAVIGREEFARLSTDEHFRYFARFAGSLLDQYARVLAGDWRSELGALGYRQYPLHLSDGEFAAFTRDLSAVLRTYLAHKPAPGRRRRLVSMILMPDTSPQANNPSERKRPAHVRPGGHGDPGR